MHFTIKQGMNQDILKSYPDNHFDSVVTDPPYGIEFLGKDWDSNTGAVETWQECLRVLKPGGHLLAFSAARTYHHLATNIESVGFEIRDQLMWLYASGFPKATQIKGHPGWKTALKPAHEPIVMARKSPSNTVKNCMDTWGTGALNIDATRIDYEDRADIEEYLNNKKGPMERGTVADGDNIGMHEGKTGFKQIKRKVTEEQDLPPGRYPSNVIGAVEGYQKYFYCPKISRAERHCGFEKLPEPYDRRTEGLDSAGIQGLKKINGEKNAQGGNNHPTVKPVELMKYLLTLVTPEGGKVLDPFNGSGSTGMAAVELGYDYTGIELDPNYVEIAQKRITGWYERTGPKNNFKDLFDAAN